MDEQLIPDDVFYDDSRDGRFLGVTYGAFELFIVFIVGAIIIGLTVFLLCLFATKYF